MKGPYDDLLPNYVAFSRLGFNTIHGRLSVLSGNICRLVVHGTPENDEYEETPPKEHIVEIGGPAFYGIKFISEDKAMMEMERTWMKKVKPCTVIECMEPVEAVNRQGHEFISTDRCVHGNCFAKRWNTSSNLPCPIEEDVAKKADKDDCPF